MATATKKAASSGRRNFLKAAAGAALSITFPVLAKGESQRGLILTPQGTPDYFLVLLPGCLERATHEEALAWAKKQGGELPDRRDGALLYANNADGAIAKEWHWLKDLLAGDPDCAWGQFFDYGCQGWGGRGSQYRAVAVRRVSIK
jgi:hypothetical protein